jgi:Adenine/guanine phosphoribosyltransferases and related PRPP-binding proteins
MSSDSTYKLEVAGLVRHPPICPVNENLDIAGFVIFSDVELTVACATELIKKLPEYDVLLTAESKGIPLAYEMSRQSGKKYILARKGKKLYMRDPIAVEVKSITTEKIQTLYLDAPDMEYLNGKRILLVDDVISTGESMAAMEELCRKAGGIVVGKAAILAEGDAADRDDLIYLQKLPLFFK